MVVVIVRMVAVVVVVMVRRTMVMVGMRGGVAIAGRAIRSVFMTMSLLSGTDFAPKRYAAKERHQQEREAAQQHEEMKLRPQHARQHFTIPEEKG